MRSATKPSSRKGASRYFVKLIRENRRRRLPDGTLAQLMAEAFPLKNRDWVAWVRKQRKTIPSPPPEYDYEGRPLEPVWGRKKVTIKKKFYFKFF